MLMWIVKQCQFMLSRDGKPCSKAPWHVFSSAIPTLPRRTALRSVIPCLAILACLALASRTLAQETAPLVKSQATISGPTTSQTGPATRDRSAALRRVVALRQELQVLVKALARLVAYQKELLALAKTSDVDAVLRARRTRQSCLQEINAAALCDALSVSFTGDDPPDDPTVGSSTVQDRGNE